MDPVAISAAVIALAALAASIAFGVLSWRHNKLSVRPILRLYVGYYSNSSNPGLWISNAGVGPALVTSFQIFVDGSEVSPGQTNWDEMKREIGADHWQFNSFSCDTPIPAGEEIALLVPPDKNRSQVADYSDMFSRLTIRIVYANIYSDAMSELNVDIGKSRKSGFRVGS